MINFFIKGAVKRAAIKLATDKNFRKKLKIVFKKYKRT